MGEEREPEKGRKGAAGKEKEEEKDGTREEGKAKKEEEKTWMWTEEEAPPEPRSCGKS